MATKEIKWGQRCIARRFETVEGVVQWRYAKEDVVNKECIVCHIFNNGSVSVTFENDGEGSVFTWLTSALEPIPETPSVWWPERGDKVLHEGKVKKVTDVYNDTHELDNDTVANYQELSPVRKIEVTFDEYIKLLEQHTGQSYKIKGV